MLADIAPSDLIMAFAPVILTLGTAIFVTIAVCSHFKQKERFLPQDAAERERTLDLHRKQKALILTVVWTSELFAAVLLSLLL